MKTCSTCRYWSASYCRASSPQIFSPGLVGVWPTTKPEDFCGQWRSTEKGEAKKSRASNEGILGILMAAGGAMPRSEMIAAIIVKFGLTRTPAISRINAMAKQNLLNVDGGMIMAIDEKS